MTSTLPEKKTTSKNDRELLLRERIRRALIEAGPEGKTAHQLAAEFYGESTITTRRRIAGRVNDLRWNGCEILCVKDKEYRVRRYVLGQYVITAQSERQT